MQFPVWKKVSRFQISQFECVSVRQTQDWGALGAFCFFMFLWMSFQAQYIERMSVILYIPKSGAPLTRFLSLWNLLFCCFSEIYFDSLACLWRGIWFICMLVIYNIFKLFPWNSRINFVQLYPTCTKIQFISSTHFNRWQRSILTEKKVKEIVKMRKGISKHPNIILWIPALNSSLKIHVSFFG